MQIPQYQILKQEQPLILQQEPPKKKGTKGIHTCWLILPFLLFLLGLIFFLILVCNYYPSNSSLDHAISVTKQLGEDVQSSLWTQIEAKKVGLTCTTKFNEVQYGEFQGIDAGNIVQVVRDSEYKETEGKESDSKEEKGIPYKKLTVMTKEGSDKYRLCIKTRELDSYYIKKTNVDCLSGERACTLTDSKIKICIKGTEITENDCPITKLAKTSGDTSGNYWNNKNLDVKRNDITLEYVIGLRTGFNLPCKNPDYLDEKPSKTDYALLGMMNSGCDEYGTYTKEQAVEIRNDLNYKNILSYNGIDDTTYPSPYFYAYITNKDAANYKVYAIHRPKVVEDSKCMIDNKGFAKLQTIREYAGEANRPLFVYFIMGLVFSAVGLFFWFILIAISKAKKQNQQSYYAEQLFKAIHLLAIVLAILEIIIFIHYMSEFKGKKDDIIAVQNAFKTAKDLNCYSEASDWYSAFEKVYHFAKNAIQIDYPLIIALFCFGVVHLALTLIVFALIKGKRMYAFNPPYSKQ